MTFQNELSFLDSFLSTAAKKKKCLFCLYTLQNEMIQLYSTMVPYMILLSFLIFFFVFSLMSMDCFYISLKKGACLKGTWFGIFSSKYYLLPYTFL